MELADQLDIKVIERDITLDEIYSADEAFLTNSLMEIMPLTVVNARGLGSGGVRALTKKLMESYFNLVVLELTLRKSENTHQ